MDNPPTREEENVLKFIHRSAEDKKGGRRGVSKLDSLGMLPKRGG